MKWFRLDSNAPTHPTSKRIIRTLGNGGFGAFVRLMCFAAQFGKSEPGRCVDSDGDPTPVEDLVDASGLSADEFKVLVQILHDTKCIQRDAWDTRQELFFRGMRSRSDAYAKWQQPKQTAAAPKQAETVAPAPSSPVVVPITDPKTEKQNGTQGPTVLAQHLLGLWNDAVTPPLAKAQKVTRKRVRLCTGVLASHGNPADAADWRTGMAYMAKAVKIVEASAFCRGANGRHWHATFDWLITSDNAVKVCEGHYSATPDSPLRVSATEARRDGERKNQDYITDWNAQKRRAAAESTGATTDTVVDGDG